MHIMTDTQRTFKTYPKLNAWALAPDSGTWVYFQSSNEFKNCKSFSNYLRSKHPGYKFVVDIDNPTI